MAECANLLGMTLGLLNDIEREAALSISEKLAQMREQYTFGVELKRRALRLQRPGASDAEVEAALSAWLMCDD